MLKQKIEKHTSNIYLVNTGWTGGPYGIGKRIDIKDTRACIDAIHSGEIENTELITDPIFKFRYPKYLRYVPEEVCQPRLSWWDKKEYDNQSIRLHDLFIMNHSQYI